MVTIRRLVRDAGGTNPRLALAAVRTLHDELDWLLVKAVRLARSEGYNWARIGRLLGVSRQAARQRFERLEPLVGPTTPFTPPHARLRTDIERQVAGFERQLADIRRRQEFERDDPVFW